MSVLENRYHLAESEGFMVSLLVTVNIESTRNITGLSWQNRPGQSNKEEMNRVKIKTVNDKSGLKHRDEKQRL